MENLPEPAAAIIHYCKMKAVHAAFAAQGLKKNANPNSIPVSVFVKTLKNMFSSFLSRHK